MIFVTAETSTSIEASMGYTTPYSQLIYYLVQVKTDTTKNCQRALNESSCSINGLSPATEYTVQAMVCLDEDSGPDACNSNAIVERQGWTKPSSKNLKNIKMTCMSCKCFKALCFFKELAKPTMKIRTDTSVTVKFVKIAEGNKPLSYFVHATGLYATWDSVPCDSNAEECRVPHLSPAEDYVISVKACITGIPSTACSDASDGATIHTLPRRK